MIYDELTLCHPLDLFVLLRHVQLHQMSFHEGITAFLNNLCQPCVYGAITTISDPPPFDPLNQNFQLLELESRGIIEIKCKRSKISNRKMQSENDDTPWLG